MTDQRRQRARQMLRAVDARATGATYRARAVSTRTESLGIPLPVLM
jgi:hypothetical protein